MQLGACGDRSVHVSGDNVTALCRSSVPIALYPSKAVLCLDCGILCVETYGARARWSMNLVQIYQLGLVPNFACDTQTDQDNWIEILHRRRLY